MSLCHLNDDVLVTLCSHMAVRDIEALSGVCVLMSPFRGELLMLFPDFQAYLRPFNPFYHRLEICCSGSTPLVAQPLYLARHLHQLSPRVTVHGASV
jgi:hypothetical protein